MAQQHLKTISLPQTSASVIMTDSLRRALEDQHVDLDVIEALRLAMLNVTTKMERSAFVYANAMERAFREYGVAGVKHQVMYLMLYMKTWRGDEATKSKKMLRKWSESETKTENTNAA